jgi:hypothetical protein
VVKMANPAQTELYVVVGVSALIALVAVVMIVLTVMSFLG